jgi:hypothetical protein
VQVRRTPFAFVSELDGSDASLSAHTGGDSHVSPWFAARPMIKVLLSRGPAGPHFDRRPLGAANVRFASVSLVRRLQGTLPSGTTCPLKSAIRP